jgi:hypothetical protein
MVYTYPNLLDMSALMGVSSEEDLGNKLLQADPKEGGDPTRQK